MKNKYIKIFFILNFLIILIVSFFFIINIQNKKNITKNIVLVEKKERIIKISKNPREIIKKEKNNSRIISNGFFIRENIVLTTAHSVGEKSDNYEITTYFGNKIKAKLIKKDNLSDIAFLRTEKKFNDFKKIKLAKKITQGENIITYFLDLKTEKIKKKNGKIIKINGNEVISNLNFKKGNSGSPIFNENLNLIGINKEFNLKDKTGISEKISSF